MSRNEAIQGLGQILIRRRDALRKALAGDLSSLKALRDQSRGDVLDAALDNALDEINSQLAEVESRELAQIENALEQMREGRYGLCQGCEKPIPLARMQALPYAILCIECQQEIEKSGGDLGDRSDWGRLLDSASAEGEVMISDLEMDAT